MDSVLPLQIFPYMDVSAGIMIMYNVAQATDLITAQLHLIHILSPVAPEHPHHHWHGHCKQLHSRVPNNRPTGHPHRPEVVLPEDGAVHQENSGNWYMHRVHALPKAASEGASTLIHCA